MSADEFYECKPPICTFVCPKCLKKFKADIHVKHIDNCHPKFTTPILQKQSRLIVQITSDSTEAEKRICERISQSSRACKRYRKSVLHKNKWNNLRAFLLIQSEQAVAYIAVSIQQQKDIVLDFFTVPDARYSRKHAIPTTKCTQNYELPLGQCLVPRAID